MEDAELRQALALTDAYRARVEAMTGQVRVLRVSLDEVTVGLEAVKAFKNAKNGDEILVPVGASSFIPVKVGEDRSVITGIGSGISVRKTADESIEYLESSSAEITEALKKSIEALDQAQQNLSAMNEAVQREYDARRRASGGELRCSTR